MKQAEKLDLILKTLYKSRKNGGSTMEEIFQTQNIPINFDNEIRILTDHLSNERYIKALLTKDCVIFPSLGTLKSRVFC